MSINPKFYPKMTSIIIRLESNITFQLKKLTLFKVLVSLKLVMLLIFFF